VVIRRAVVTIYVRHSVDCRHHRSPFYRGCQCAKWLRYSGDACFCKAKARQRPHKQHKLSADTRTWATAEDERAELQDKLGTGDTTNLLSIQSESRRTVAQAIETFITAKESEGCSKSTIRKLRFQLGSFEHFLSERSKFFPDEITATDAIEFRSGWRWKSGVTKQKAQQNIRGFLRSCCKDNLQDLLRALKTIRLSKADVERLEPQPFSEKEIKTLLGQVSKTFVNEAEKAARMTALIHLQLSTGLAISDAIQLERDNIRGGWLRIKRQKTGKPVKQKLDESLHSELLDVANSNPKYVFWNGTTLLSSATGLWEAYLRTLMQDAGVWIKGNLSHRFRDTTVDF
jgi:integrase/recombinase XerD